MPAISGGGLGAAAQEILKELQKQQKPAQAEPQKSFGSLINKAAGQPQAPNAAAGVTNVSPATKIGQVDKTQQALLKTVQPTSKTEGKFATGLKGLLNSWNKDHNTLNKITKMALSGKKFSPSELLVLQSATFKASFDLETVAKLVETASSAVKTTMQTQV